MNKEKEIRLAYGFNPKFIPIPEGIDRLRVHSRIAVILESYRSDKVDMFFDSETFIRIIEYLNKHTLGEPKSILVGNTIFSENPMPDLVAYYAKIEENDRGLPDIIKWENAVALPEPWYLVGGPMPYHDSFTLAIYPHKEIFPELRDDLPRFIKSIGCSRPSWHLEY